MGPYTRADSWKGPDKVAHFGVALGLTAGTYGLLMAINPGWGMGPRSGISAGVGLGLSLLKEGCDLGCNTGDPSGKDLLYGALGTAIGVGIMVLIDTLLGANHNQTVETR